MAQADSFSFLNVIPKRMMKGSIKSGTPKKYAAGREVAKIAESWDEKSRTDIFIIRRALKAS